jgi:hypothetical protein
MANIEYGQEMFCMTAVLEAGRGAIVLDALQLSLQRRHRRMPSFPAVLGNARRSTPIICQHATANDQRLSRSNSGKLMGADPRRPLLRVGNLCGVLLISLDNIRGK